MKKFLIPCLLALPLLSSCTVIEEEYYAPGYYGPPPPPRVEVERHYPQGYYRDYNRHYHGQARYRQVPRGRVYQQANSGGNAVIVTPRGAQQAYVQPNNVHGHVNAGSGNVHGHTAPGGNVHGHGPVSGNVHGHNAPNGTVHGHDVSNSNGNVHGHGGTVQSHGANPGSVVTGHTQQNKPPVVIHKAPDQQSSAGTVSPLGRPSAAEQAAMKRRIKAG